MTNPTDKLIEQLVGALEEYVNNDDVDLHLNGIKQKALAALANAELVEDAATEPVAWFDVRCEGCGYMTHHREHMGCVRAAKQHTHPSPSVPGDVVRDAERYRWLRDYLISPSTHFDDLIVSADKAETLNGVIDTARAARSADLKQLFAESPNPRGLYRQRSNNDTATY